MFTVIVSFKFGNRKRVIINNLNRVQVERVTKNWEKNPDVSYVGVLDERF